VAWRDHKEWKLTDTNILSAGASVLVIGIVLLTTIAASALRGNRVAQHKD
jgi:hypothetical protein